MNKPTQLLLSKAKHSSTIYNILVKGQKRTPHNCRKKNTFIPSSIVTNLMFGYWRAFTVTSVVILLRSKYGFSITFIDYIFVYIHFTIFYMILVCVYFNLCLWLFNAIFVLLYVSKQRHYPFLFHIFKLSNGNDCCLYGSINVLQSDQP